MEGQIVIKGGFVLCYSATSSWIRNIICSKAAALAVVAAAAFPFSRFFYAVVTRDSCQQHSFPIPSP